MSDSGAIERTLAGDPRMAAVYRWVENNLDRKKNGRLGGRVYSKCERIRTIVKAPFFVVSRWRRCRACWVA